MHWLNAPYPLLQSARYKWLYALLSGIFVLIFLIVFEPFGAGKLKADKYLFLAGIGFSVFLGVGATYFILPKLFRQFFRPETWIIGKEIIWQSCCLLIINICICLHNSYVGRADISFETFFNFLKITISIGIFPIVGLIFFTERTLSKRNINRAQLLSKELPTAATAKTNTVQIQEESVKASPITMILAQFVYAQSEGNYVKIYHLNDNELVYKLIRLSLKQLEIQLENISQIKRCHRSYLINVQHIIAIDGNARSLTIQLDKVATGIPVSRSFSKGDFH